MKLYGKFAFSAVMICLCLAAQPLGTDRPIVLHETVSAASYKMSAPSSHKTEFGADRISLTWNSVSGADGYEVSVRYPDEKNYRQYVITDVPSCVVTGLYPGTVYSVKVTSVKLSGGEISERGKSAVWKIRTSGYKGYVTKIESASYVDGYFSAGQQGVYVYDKVEISWKAVDGAEGYRIFSQRNVALDNNPSYSVRYTESNGRVYALITSTQIPAGKDISFKVYPFKTINGVKCIGKPRTVTITTQPPKATDIAEMAGNFSELRFTSLGNYTYISSGGISCDSEMMSVRMLLSLFGITLERAASDSANCEKYYMDYGDAEKIGVIYFYTDNADPNYLKISIINN